MAEGLSSYGTVAADAFACTLSPTYKGIALGVAKSTPADPNDYEHISIHQTATPKSTRLFP